MIFPALLLLVGGVRGMSNETMDTIVISSTPADTTVSCNDTDSCEIIVTASCAGCTFNCPTMSNCISCSVDCSGNDVCDGVEINSYECDEVFVTGDSVNGGDNRVFNGATINGPMGGDLLISVESNPSALRDATINGPTDGDLTIEVNDCSNGLNGATVNGPKDGDLFIRVTESSGALEDTIVNGPSGGNMEIEVIGSSEVLLGDDLEINTVNTTNLNINVSQSEDNTLKIFGADLSGTLTLTCTGSTACSGSSITCPQRNESEIDGPNCFITCVEDACGGMMIDSTFGTPTDVRIDCGSDAAACSGTTIDCSADAPCLLTQDDSDVWTCSETECKTITDAPTQTPSSQPTLVPTEITNEPSAMPIDPSSTETPPMVTQDEAAASTTMGAGATEDDETTSSGEGMMTTDDPSLKDGGDSDNEFPVWVGVLIGIFVFLLLVCIIVLGISNRNKEKQQRSGRDLVPTVNEEEVPATSTGASAAETPKNEEEIELATDKGHAPAESGDDLYGDAAIGRSHTRGASEGGDPAVTGTTPAGGEEVQKDDAQIVGMQTAGAGENDKALNMLAGDDEKPANDAEPELQGGDEGPEEDDDDVLDGGITTGGGTGDGADIGNTGGGDYAD